MTNADTGKFQLWRFLLSPRGRISRGAFALYSLPTGIGTISLRWLLRYQMQHNLSITLMVMNALLGLVEIVLLWPRFATTSKRLQDFGCPGGLGLITFLPLLLAFGYEIYFIKTIGTNQNISHSPLRLVLGTVFYGVWGITALLCFIPGTKGMNRYGPPPNGPQTYPADAF